MCIFLERMNKVSIIVPVFNVEKYLQRCMDSLLNQTLKDIEIIMVDDESPDNCPQLCEDYRAKYPNVKVVHKKNGGLGYARNSGLEICEGEYVAFIDSDDFVDIHMFEDLYDYAHKNRLDACFCGYNDYLDEKHIRKRQEMADYVICEGRSAVDGVLMDMVGAEPSYPSDVRFLSSMWKGIYSLDTIRKNKLKFVSEREYIAEDIMFHIDFLPHTSKVGFVPGCYYYYCDNGTSLTRSYRSDRFAKELFQCDAMEKRLLAYGYEPEIFRNRLDRYLLLKIRGCIAQQYYYISKNGYRMMRAEALTIVSSPEVRVLCKRYPSSRLPVKHHLFFNLIRYKLIDLIFLFYKISS